VVSATLMRQYCVVRYLTIVRHAKTSPAGPGESDFVRTLNKRGREECEKLRAWANDPTKLGQTDPRLRS
jgi:phosphohistidine phosphatase SixA